MNGDLPRPFRVTRVRRETRRSTTLTLEPADGLPFAFQPGQFNMLAPLGHGDVPISMSGDCEAGFVEHTIADVGITTGALCALKKGQQLGVRGPFGRGWPEPQARGRDLLLVAGGVGLAPLRPMLYALARRPERYGRAMLLYGAREPRDLLFLAQLKKRVPVLETHLTVDLADADWHGRVGTVMPLLRQVEELHQPLVMACGPEIMLRLGARDLVSRGVVAADLYLSLERNMKCAFGICGHCQLGGHLVCRDGPVFAYPEVAALLEVRQL